MATERSQTDLLTLYNDNAAGDIGAVDLQDFVETMKRSFGSCRVNTPTATTISSAGTYYVQATTTSTVDNYRFSHSSPGRLTYTGTPSIGVHLNATLSMSASGTNQLLGIAWAKNGTVITQSIIERLAATGADQAAIAVSYMSSAATNDYFELFVTNSTTTNSVQIDHGFLSAWGYWT